MCKCVHAYMHASVCENVCVYVYMYVNKCIYVNACV